MVTKYSRRRAARAINDTVLISTHGTNNHWPDTRPLKLSSVFKYKLKSTMLSISFISMLVGFFFSPEWLDNLLLVLDNLILVSLTLRSSCRRAYIYISLLLLRSSIEGVFAYVTAFPPSTWAAAFRLRNFNLVYDSCVLIPPAVRRTLSQQMDMGSLTRAQIHVRVVLRKGVRHK